MTQKSSAASEILTVSMWAGISRAEMFNEVNRAMQISGASGIQIMQARFWKRTLHCFFPSHRPPYLSFLSSTSKNQFDKTASSLNLAWFQEERNFVIQGKISLHGEGPNGKSNDSIFPEESCPLRLCSCRRESEQLQYSLDKMCVCAHGYGDMTQCFVTAPFILGPSLDR